MLSVRADPTQLRAQALEPFGREIRADLVLKRNESAIYVNNNTVIINVYAGDFSESTYAFNVHDTSGAGENPVIVLHSGVSYYTFLKSGTIDVIASDINGARIAADEGCEIVYDGDFHTVVNSVEAK